MELINETSAVAEWTLGFQKNGREFVCLVAKMTFDVSPHQKEASIAAEQLPLTQADEYTGAPGLSAVAFESDFAHEKPLCDVLLNGSAYAPGGIPHKKVIVGLHVGSINKRFEVIGDRFWDRRIMGISPSSPQPYTKKRISYDIAYGGTSCSKSKRGRIQAYPENPIGQGFYPLEKGTELIGKPVANTQELKKPAIDRNGKYRPMAFGPVGRNFKGRVDYAGTYDQSWLEKRAPFFPDDFDYRYYQAAPPDQQMPYPKSDLNVTLQNLTPDSFIRFRVPLVQFPVLVLRHGRYPKKYSGNIDTILIEPDINCVSVTWRLKIPLQKSIFDLSHIIVGRGYKNYHRRNISPHKPYYKGLGEFIKAQGEVRKR